VSVRPPTAVFLLAAVVWLGWLATQPLMTISRSGPPRPLALTPPAARSAQALDVVLPVVPIGLARLRDGQGVMVVHYWAPWQRHARAQAAALDSLRHLPGLEGVEITVACADPFPSVARFVGRQRLRLRVVIDGRHALRDALPCPSVPYTYVLDSRGRVAVAQAGEIDWLAPATRAALRALGDEPPAPPAVPPAAPL
jgi:hypothetical protein